MSKQADELVVKQPADAVKEAHVVSVQNSPGPLTGLRWSVRLTYWSGHQQVETNVKNSRVFPPEYSDLDMHGDGPGGHVAIGYAGDSLVYFIQCYPVLTDCEGQP